MNISKILVPVDFSEHSKKALDYALFLAGQFNAHIMLLHVVVLFEEDADDEERLDAYERIIQQKESQRSTLLEQHQSLGDDHGVTVDSELVRGISAADTILDHLEDHEYDLVVMGTHGRTGLTKWFFGSVAEKVLRLCRVPLLSVRKEVECSPIERILVPVDFSPFASRAVEWSRHLAALFGAGLSFLHSLETEAPSAFYGADLEAAFRFDSDLKSRVKENLAGFVGLPPEEAAYVVVEGSAHTQIEQFAVQSRTDLIVMPSRGYGRLEHFLTGSTTERVVGIAPCPVLTVGRRATETDENS